VIDDYHELSAPQIAEEAGVPIESFFELFDSKEECFLAAFDDLSDELLEIAADPDLVSGDWARAVRRVVGELLRLLAERPLYAHVIASEAPSACPEALERDYDLARSIATLLTEGAPEPARNKLAVEGVAGAIWHTIRCQVANGQIQLLPALSDYLAYIVLAPFIGADAAAEVVIEDESALAAGAPVAG
jgi:AcrR family transcriptional regulator